MPEATMAKALNSALRDSLEGDDRVLIFGEDVGRLGGVFRITDGLQDQFGEERIFDSPLAESGIIGTAIGLAMYGYRPVPEMQFDAFAFPAFQQIVSHLAKLHNRSRGTIKLPVTVRIPYGGGIGAVEHHSESPETYWAHTPGLLVATPGSPADAYSLLRQCIGLDDPVIFMEPKRRYWMKGAFETDARPLPVGNAAVCAEGTDVTVIAYGPQVETALEAARAGEEEGWSIEVVDLRWLNPLDEDTIVTSVKKTGRCVVVHEAPMTLGIGAEIAARVQELAFSYLEAPVLRATGFDTPYPAARLEDYWLPDVDRVLDFVARALDY
jgi:2-oxoisovalerate dehydrogenase E1 component beta subunit